MTEFSDEHLLMLGRMDGKLDLLINRSDDQEKRLNGVEKRVWYASGAAAFIAAFFATKIKTILGA